MFSVWHFRESRAVMSKGKGKYDCFCASILLTKVERQQNKTQNFSDELTGTC
jgi:hypothetical protein